MIALHNATAQSIAVTNRLSSLGYSGEHFDAKAQQQYLRARFYNPANGSFNRLDPFAGNMQDPQSLHKYAYVHGDPVQGIDPTGLMLGGGFGGLGGIALAVQIGSAAINGAAVVYNIQQGGQNLVNAQMAFLDGEYWDGLIYSLATGANIALATIAARALYASYSAILAPPAALVGVASASAGRHAVGRMWQTVIANPAIITDAAHALRLSGGLLALHSFCLSQLAMLQSGNCLDRAGKD